MSEKEWEIKWECVIEGDNVRAREMWERLTDKEWECVGVNKRVWERARVYERGWERLKARVSEKGRG